MNFPGIHVPGCNAGCVGDSHRLLSEAEKMIDPPIPYEIVQHDLMTFGEVEPVGAVTMTRVVQLDDYREIPLSLGNMSDDHYVSDERLVAAAKVIGAEEVRIDIDDLETRAGQYERWAERARHTAEVLREWLASP